MPAMLAGVEALAPEHLRAPAGRYPVYGITFTWPERLTSPERFRFESNDGAWLRLDWRKRSRP
ncbi:MAG TPA: hypothetical protein VGK73_16750 [Polyangiaceae bacterium]